MIDFWVGYTPGREIANRKCRQSLAQFGVVTNDVPHYWVPKTNNPFARTRYLVPLIDYRNEKFCKPHNNEYVTMIEDLSNTKNLKDSFSIIRDQSWLYWRTMECPYKKNLYFFELKYF